MTENKKKGIILLVVSIFIFITAANMYYNFVFFNNLLGPGSPIDEQTKDILKYVAMFDALVGFVLLGFGIYFVKKEDGVK